MKIETKRGLWLIAIVMISLTIIGNCGQYAVTPENTKSIDTDR